MHINWMVHSSICLIWSVTLILLSFGMDEPKCHVGIESKTHVADCSNMRLISVPDNLPSNIEALDLSWNSIDAFENDSFIKYRNLNKLYLFRNPGKFSSFTFYPLSKLEILRLDYIHSIPNLNDLYLPPSIGKLHLSGMTELSKLDQLPFAKLTKLKILRMDSCDLKLLPSFGGILYNLEELNISNNPLTHFGVENITQFCQLKYLHISKNTDFGKSCRCQILKKWAEEREFHHSEYCFSLRDSEKATCNITTANIDRTNYYKCLSIVQEKKVILGLQIGGVIFFIIFVLSLICLYYRRRTKNRIIKT